MGWWSQNEQGRSFEDLAAEPMVWGDPVADLMADAVVEIVGEFRRKWGREPTKAEVRAGLEFCLGGYGDGPNVATEPVEAGGER